MTMTCGEDCVESLEWGVVMKLVKVSGVVCYQKPHCDEHLVQEKLVHQ